MPLRKHKVKKWEQTDHIVEQWLQERQELLVLYYQLSKSTPFDEETYDDDVTETIAKFCQIVTDYVSAGHFEIFETILSTNDAGNTVTCPTKELFNKILDTTKSAIDFCNKYSRKKFSIKNLKSDLSELGEQLAKRMDLEDNLIKIYLLSTKSIKTK